MESEREEVKGSAERASAENWEKQFVESLEPEQRRQFEFVTGIVRTRLAEGADNVTVDRTLLTDRARRIVLAHARRWVECIADSLCESEGVEMVEDMAGRVFAALFLSGPGSLEIVPGGGAK